MSRVLTICLLLFFVSQSAFAQIVPEPGQPPQLSSTITVSAGNESDVVFFGLDLRATDGYDADPGLLEDSNLPPWSPAMEARWVRLGNTDELYTDRDYRFGDGADQVVSHFLEFQKSMGDVSNTITLAWDLPVYIAGVIKDLNGGTLAVMNGSGSWVVNNNILGNPEITLVEVEISYTNIPEELGLPVELTSFEALLAGDVAHLNWETASELNNAGFEVQQELNGSFETIAFVAGNGTTDQAQSYSYTTGSLSAGVHAFRLKQIDFDGAFEYSDEVSVDIALEAAAELSKPYPDPFNPQTQFTLTIARQQEVTIQVYDMLGRQVQTLYQGTLAPSEAHLFTFQASSLPSGRYFIRAAGEYFNNTQTVTLLK